MRRSIMLATFQELAKQSNKWRAISCVIGAVALIAMTQFALLGIITGRGKTIDLTSNPDTYKGKYITVHPDFLHDGYIEHITNTKMKYSKETSTRVNGYSYVACQSVKNDKNGTSILYCYSVYLGKERVLSPPHSFTGIWTKMDSQTEKYFRDALEDLGISPSVKNRFYFYELDAENIGGVNSILFWVLMVIAFGLFVYAIVCVAGIYNLAYMNPIQQYLRENSSVSLSDIETDFNEAHLVESHVWIGKIWTIFMAGNKAKILVNRDLTWGYHYCGNGLNSVSQMRLYTNIQYETAYINLSESGTKEALKIYEEEQPHILTGYNLELERLYEQDFNAFLELKYNPRIKKTSSSGFSC